LIINTYGYVGANPLGYIDSLGLCEDDCEDLAKKITKRRNELAKRESDLRVDKNKLRAIGKNSIAGHIQQFKDKQKNLRDLLDQYDSQGCGGGGGGSGNIPSDARSFSTMPVPIPGIGSRSNSGTRGGARSGGGLSGGGGGGFLGGKLRPRRPGINFN